MKIGFLITARLKSSRLPFKVLMNLDGKTVIERIIDRAKMVQNISEIVICTSTNPQDKPLVDIAKKNDVFYFNGHEDDVLNRLLIASKLFDLDYFVGITADNPLFTIHYSNLITDIIKKEKIDYVKIKGLPLGVATYGIKVKALETVCRIKEIVDTEIWGYLIDRPEIFDVKKIEVKSDYKKPDIRLTLDYIEDYDLINNIYSNIGFKNVINFYDVVKYLNNNPKIARINKDCEQIDLDEKTKKFIDKNYEKRFDEIKDIKKRIYSKRD